MAETVRDARFEVDETATGDMRLSVFGDWVLASVGKIDAGLRDVAERSLDRQMIIDLAGVERIDTAGAFVLQRTMQACGGRTDVSQFQNIPAGADLLLSRVGRSMSPCDIEPRPVNAFVLMLNRLGMGAEDAYLNAARFFTFVSLVFGALGRLALDPRRLRVVSTVHHMEEAGLNAVPIVGLMSFMIGAVVAFMGARILSQFGAEVLTVELVGIAVLREFAVLLTAILIAGRSGSAFTAAIGSMKLREEIDAMRTLGLDPNEVLILPRVLALVTMTPLLVFVAMLLGLTGGLLVIWFALDVSPSLFLSRTQDVVVLSHFWVGIIKAPVFAFAIAVIGCHQGFLVSGSAESLGQRTTLAVVQSIFTVILLDAVFAMIFLELGV
ncbi:MAG: ABC transporter permease [Pseudomonadota bacterium]